MAHLCSMCRQLGELNLVSQMASYSWCLIFILVYFFSELLYRLICNQCFKDYKNGIYLNPVSSAFVRASKAANHRARVGCIISITAETIALFLVWAESCISYVQYTVWSVHALVISCTQLLAWECAPICMRFCWNGCFPPFLMFSPCKRGWNSWLLCVPLSTLFLERWDDLFDWYIWEE